MPTSVVVSPESSTQYSNEEEYRHISIVGGPAVLRQADRVAFVKEGNKPVKVETGGFDLFAIESARITFYAEDEDAPSDNDEERQETEDNAPKAKHVAQQERQSKVESDASADRRKAEQGKSADAKVNQDAQREREQDKSPSAKVASAARKVTDKARGKK